MFNPGQNDHILHGAVLTADARWSVWMTGGGCHALGRHVDVNKPEGAWWLITVADDAQAPERMDEEVALGLYNADGEQMGAWYCQSVWEALAIANTFRQGEGLK